MDKNIEINTEFAAALDVLENTSRHIFITGKAGTGKSTLLEYFRDRTEKLVVVLASTGVSAVNVKGETIHSFFGFKPDITPEKVRKIRSRKRSALYKNIDTIIIDEVSMVRADLMDCVDVFLRLNGRDPDLPFGGTQMVFIGDMYQLPPVVPPSDRGLFGRRYESAYFFSSDVFKKIDLEYVELVKIYRQKDEKLIDILNGIRDNTISEEDLCMLNRSSDPCVNISDLDQYVYMAPTNRLSAGINRHQLRILNAEEYVYEAKVEGAFDSRFLPADPELRIKRGAQVMLIKNDEYGRWVNGTIGHLVDIKKEDPDDILLVNLPDGDIAEIKPCKWEVFHFKYNPDIGEIESEVKGHVVQYPLKLAWAITIHKSQGKTFNKAVIDVTGGLFACGQLYVALSRCRSLKDIILKRPVRREHILVDRRIKNFLAGLKNGTTRVS